ncbi:MAG: hypothetical protein J1E02_05000 [Coprobacter sp.]|nr:hypothetical protein [Coprobacter sp.]
MKKQLFKVLAIALLAGGTIACTSEDENGLAVGGSDNGSLLVRTPDVHAYTGGYDIATLSANVNGNLWYQDWDRPTNVTEAERAKVIEEFSKQRIGVKNDIHIDWHNYWVQQVYTGEQTYTDGYGQNIGTGSSHMNHLLAYSSKENKVVSWWDPVTQGPVYELVDKTGDCYEHINNFNSGSNNTVYTDDETKEQYYGTTLMTDMYAEGIIDQFGYHNSTDSKNHYEYIILEIDGYYYIGFDFYATHPDGQDANKNMDVERDWVFNDWIVRISPAYHVGETPETPEGPEVKIPDVVDPGFPVDPEGPEVKFPDPLDPGFTGPYGPEAPIKDEVEINLLGDNKNGEYLESHLSIHVRAATDVEVFIPVPEVYYCDADDMAIVEKHIEDLMLHGGPIKTEYNIAGTTISLNIKFVTGGIRVWTEGINEEVINYCGLTYQDGITFEVWNYFNDNITLEELETYLNQATVKFLDKLPDAYINAFNDPDGVKNPHDCTVTIVDEQRNSYNDPYEGLHYNGSPYNQIYRNKAGQQ